MKVFKWRHSFEWLVNLLLVIVPLGLILGGWLNQYQGNADGWDFVQLFGLLLMFPISLGCLIFYGWDYGHQRPHRLRGYQWGLVLFYLIWLIISLTIGLKMMAIIP